MLADNAEQIVRAHLDVRTAMRCGRRNDAPAAAERFAFLVELELDDPTFPAARRQELARVCNLARGAREMFARGHHDAGYQLVRAIAARRLVGLLDREVPLLAAA